MPRLFPHLFVAFILIFSSFFIGQSFLPNQSARSAVLAAQKEPDYRIVFIGDSMTEYLGNFDELRSYLYDYFPDKNFLLLNYGFGSTNIESVPDRLEKDSTHSGRIFMPVNDIPFDLVIIESMGHNPLSGYSLQEGLQKQNQALDQIMASLTQKHPRSSIVFLATIAPNTKNYAKNTVELSDQKRAEWAKERSAYIENHIAYAKGHGIPLIDAYHASQDSKGDGQLKYISKVDYIHPSPKGVYFISKEIASFIYKQHLLPTK